MTQLLNNYIDYSYAKFLLQILSSEEILNISNKFNCYLFYSYEIQLDLIAEKNETDEHVFRHDSHCKFNSMSHFLHRLEKGNILIPRF